jgi:hypothetical protein
MSKVSADLRRAVLAAAVLDDLPVAVDPAAGDDLRAGAVVVTDPQTGRATRLTWEDTAMAVGAWRSAPSHPVTRARLAAVVAAAVRLAGDGPGAFASALVLHAEVPGSPRFPGAGWAWDRRPGSGGPAAGWGIVVDDGELSLPLPPAPGLVAAIARARRHRRRAEADLAALGASLVERLDRDRREGRDLVLRPMGPADVPTLLMSRTVREWVAGLDGTGLGTVAVPTRLRGWVDVRRIDPPYVAAAHAATDALDAASPVPFLVTADGVSIPSGSVPRIGRPDAVADSYRS